MDRRRLVSFFFIALLLYILFNVFFILSPFAHPLFWGMIIAFAFYPVYEKTLRWSGKNDNLAAGIVTAVLFLTVTPILIMLFLLIVRETVHLYDGLAAYIKEGGAERLYERARGFVLFRRIEALQLSPWESIGTQVNQWLLNSAGVIGNFVVKHATVFTKNLFHAVFNFFLTFFIVFFFFRDGAKIYRFIYDATPLEDESKGEILGQLSETLAATLRGQLFTGLAQASVLGVVFWILGLPVPVIFAAFAFLASMIPVLGASTVWGPFAVWLFATHQFGRGAALLVLGVLVISGIDNVLKPLLIGQKAKLPYSLLFLGILGGIQVYGFMGIFLAPVVLSLFFVLVRIYRQKFAADAA